MIIEQSDSLADIVADPRLQASLREIVLTSPDIDQLSGFYENALGYVGERTADAWTGHLSTRRLSIRDGAANAIDRAIFTVPDENQLRALELRLQAADVPHEKAGGLGLRGDALHFADPDGNRLTFGLADDDAAQERGSIELTARLQHVVYASDRVAMLLAFYQGIVGFAPSDFVFDEAGDLTSVFLRCGDEHHSLAVFRARRRRLDHICYDVADWSQIRDWADRFAARHISLRWGPGRHGPGNNLFLFINDPDGNWLEFSAELERVEDPRAPGRWVHEERTLNSWGSAFLRS